MKDNAKDPQTDQKTDQNKDQKKDANFLDLIPQRDCQWENSGDGRISLLVPRFRRQWMKKLAMKMGKSEFVKVQLDTTGSNVWTLIDGQKTVTEIGQFMEKTDDEPLDMVYRRLTEFIGILARNRFVYFTNY